MERYSDKAIEIVNDLHTERLDYASEYIPLIDAAQQLAAYEDTGLIPRGSPANAVDSCGGEAARRTRTIHCLR